MSRRDRLFAAALVLFVLATTGLQAITTAPIKSAVKAAQADGAALGKRALADIAWGALGPGDVALVVLAVVSGLAILFFEVRGGAIRRFLAASLSRRRAAVALFVVVAALSLRSGLDAGVPNGADAKLHFAKTASVMRAIESGDYPSWSHEWYGGMPLLRFYGPLFYLLAGAFGALLGSAAAGVKLVLGLAHVAAGLFTAAWVRRLTGSGRGALAAGLIVLLAGPRAHALYGLGRLPIALVYAAFPLALWGVERFVRDDHFVGAGATTALGLSALVLTHPGLAPFGLVLVVLYAMLRFIPSEGWGALMRHSTVGYVGAVAVLGAVLTLWWVVPVLEERSNVMLDLQYGGTPSVVPTLVRAGDASGAIAHPLLVRVGLVARRGGSSVGYVGISLLVLALLGLGRALHGRTRLALALLVPIGVVFAWLGGGYFQARCVHFVAPLLAAGAALWFSGKDESTPVPWGRLALVLLLVDLLPIGVSSSFRPDLEPLRESFRSAVEEHSDERVVYGSERRGVIAVSQWGTGLDSGLMVLGGPFREAATDVYPWAVGLLHWAGEELRSGEPISADLRAALARFGVSRLAVEDGSALRDRSRTADAPTLVVAMLPGGVKDGTPLAERKGRGIEADLRALFDASQETEVAHRWAERLREALREEGSISSPTDGDSGEHPPPGRVTSIGIDRQGLAATIVANGPCVVSVRVAAYPGTIVRVDGSERPLRRDAFGFVMMELDSAGTFAIDVRSPSRGPRGLTGIGLLVAAFVALVAASRGRSRDAD